MKPGGVSQSIMENEFKVGDIGIIENNKFSVGDFVSTEGADVKYCILKVHENGIDCFYVGFEEVGWSYSWCPKKLFHKVDAPFEYKRCCVKIFEKRFSEKLISNLDYIEGIYNLTHG
jgi:hypothetical protein